MGGDTKRQFFEDYTDGWNEHDPEKAVAQFAEGGTYFDPNVGEKLRGAEIGEYIAGAAQGFPDLHFDENLVLTTDNGEELKLAAYWTMHGTHTGSLDGLPPTGNTIALDGVDIVTISDDGITSVTGYFDQKTFADQLGLTFPKILLQLPKLTIGAIRQGL